MAVDGLAGSRKRGEVRGWKADGWRELGGDGEARSIPASRR